MFAMSSAWKALFPPKWLACLDFGGVARHGEIPQFAIASGHELETRASTSLPFDGGGRNDSDALTRSIARAFEKRHVPGDVIPSFKLAAA